MRNCRSSLKRRRARPLRRYDALPAPLRKWLQQAALPWSVLSAERLWHKRLAQNGGDAKEALAWLSQVELRHLNRDAAKIWGAPIPDQRPPPPNA